VIQIKTDMDFGFLGALPVVGPGHGESGINQGPVNADQISQVAGFAGENAGGFGIEGFKNLQELFQTSGIVGFEETALFDPLRGGAMAVRAKSSSLRAWRRCRPEECSSR